MHPSGSQRKQAPTNVGNLKNSSVKGLVQNNGQNVRKAQRIETFTVSIPRPEGVMDKTVTSSTQRRRVLLA